MDFLTVSEQEILAIATPIMDNLMQTSTDIDHERHVQGFTDKAKAIVTKERRFSSYNLETTLLKSSG